MTTVLSALEVLYNLRVQTFKLKCLHSRQLLEMRLQLFIHHLEKVVVYRHHGLGCCFLSGQIIFGSVIEGLLLFIIRSVYNVFRYIDAFIYNYVNLFFGHVFTVL